VVVFLISVVILLQLTLSDLLCHRLPYHCRRGLFVAERDLLSCWSWFDVNRSTFDEDLKHTKNDFYIFLASDMTLTFDL